MPFTEKTHVLHAVDCTQATEDDRVKAVLSDTSFIVFQLKPELEDGLERLHPGHARLHLVRTMTHSGALALLERNAFPQLTHRLPRKLKRRAEPSMINFFVWADNHDVWTGGVDGYGQHRFELVSWLQIPGEPENYFPNTPVRLNASLVEVEFFTV